MTSMPASRSARAMIFAPRSWPSRPGFAMTTLIFRATRRILVWEGLDRGCFRAPPGLLLRNEVAIPVVALLRHALERRIVDEDEPEALPVAPGPLEVVHESPHEVAPDGRSGLDGTTDRVDVALEVVAPLRIADRSFVAADVGECSAVLGDVQRARGVVVADANEQVVEAVGVHLPVHVGVLRAGLAH